MTTMTTITVRELIDRLGDEDPDARVVFGADYGDHCHTEQALPIRGYVEAATITPSAYSGSGYAIGEPDDDDVDDATYVVIR